MMLVCNFCGSHITRGDKAVCTRCKGVYHKGCWAISGSCCVKGCISSEAEIVPEIKPAPKPGPLAEKDKPKKIPDNTVYRTNPMDTRTKVMPRPSGLNGFIKRLRWERIAIVAGGLLGLFIIIMLLNFVIGLLGFNKVEKLYLSGKEKFDQKSYSEAVKLFEEAFISDPDYPELKSNLIDAHGKLLAELKNKKKYDEAYDEFKRLSELTGDNKPGKFIEFYSLWTDELIKDGKYQDAREKLKKIIELDKSNSAAKQKLSDVLVKMLYDAKQNTTTEQAKLILEDSNAKSKIKNDGIKLYTAKSLLLKYDVDNDKFNELIVAGEDTNSQVAGIQIYSIKDKKPKLVKSVDTTGYYINNLQLMDINKDKKFIVVSDWTEPGTTKAGFNVFLFPGDGQISCYDTRKISDSPVHIKDIDKNGGMEIIAEKLSDIKLDNKDVFIPYIYQWKNGEILNVSNKYGNYYKEHYILPWEEKLKKIPKRQDYMEQAIYEENLNNIIIKLYSIAGLTYESKTGKASPEETIQANFDYINQHEYYKAFLLRSTKRRETMSFEGFYSDWRNNLSVRVNKLEVVSQNEKKSEVSVEFDSTDKGASGEDTKSFSGTYYLVKEGNLWYLDNSRVKQL